MAQWLKGRGVAALMGVMLVACGPVSVDPPNPDGAGSTGGTPDAGSGCTPLAECPGPGKACGSMPDGCGGTLNCGACWSTETCGALTASYCASCEASGFCTENLTKPTVTPGDIFGLAADDVWITDSATEGRIYEWKPTGWTDRSTQDPRGGPVQLWGTSASNLWGVAYSGIWHWDGVRWTLTETRWTRLRDIGGTAANDIWVVGNGGTILHYDGTQWTQVTSGTTADLVSVSVRGPDDVWATGQGAVVLHRDSQGWKIVYPAQGSYLYRQIAGISPTEALVIESVSGVVYRVTTAGDVETLYGSGQYGKAWTLWAFSPTDIWAVGSWASIQHFDGTTWTTLESNPYGTRTYDCIWGAPNGDVWIAKPTQVRRRAAR